VIKENIDYIDDTQRKNKFNDIMEGAITIAGMALKHFERPVPGKIFKDPTEPTIEEIDKLISTADRMIKIKFNQLNSMR
jgi:hypothetical protein